MRSYFLFCLLCCLFPSALFAERFTPERLWDLRRIGDAAVSPDGERVAFLVTDYDLEANEGKTSLLLQPLSELTRSDKEAADRPAKRLAIGFDTTLAASETQTLLRGIKGLNSLAWLNHSTGPKLVYIAPGETPDASEEEIAADESSDPSSRQQTAQASPAEGDETGAEDENQKPQAWMIDPENGSPVQLTRVPQGIANLIAAPSGDRIAFTVDVKMDETVNEIYQDLPKADARIIDSLMYRHWNQWHDHAYSHVHVAKIDDSGNLSTPIDLMASLKADCPLPPFGGTEHFAFSPDGKELALTLKLVNDPAQSTDSGIYLVDAEGGPLKPITPGMPGYDRSPTYSPDGRFLAFHSMERAGFESDRNRIFLYDRQQETLREITKGLDQTTHNATWGNDSQFIYFDSETRGTQQVFRIDIDGSQPQPITKGRFNFSIVAAIPEMDVILVRQQNMLRPTELALASSSNGSATTITDVNGAIYQELELPTIEQRFVTATDGKPIHNWVIYPPDFDAKSPKQYPMLTYCQGGPQGQIGQWFSYRWNFHLMASRGYVVLAVNRRGMPGFGRQWNDQISGDWGGQAMQDILAATDAMIADAKIDRERVGAVGASFGGYTVYWLMGNAGQRFKTMAAHCGVFNLESMYGSTEELFFVNWDLGGPYWSSEKVAEDYTRFSPHRFVGNWKTPLLVIHGEKDFRVPVTQGMEAFTAAQVQGVPSRFLYFPEEGHWVLSPQNGVLWGRVFFDWLDRYLKPETVGP